MDYLRSSPQRDTKNILTSASSLEDGSVEWKLITGAEGSLSDLIENMEIILILEKQLSPS
jgi:hypothetical protein